MTFDEAIEVLANSENNKLVKEGQLEYGLYRAYDVVGILQRLKQEYAPTVEMKPYQFEVFKKYRYGVSKGDIDFGGIWPDEPYRMMEYFKEEPYTGTTIWDDSFAQAWLHPETIEVIDNEQ